MTISKLIVAKIILALSTVGVAYASIPRSSATQTLSDTPPADPALPPAQAPHDIPADAAPGAVGQTPNDAPTTDAAPSPVADAPADTNPAADAAPSSPEIDGPHAAAVEAGTVTDNAPDASTAPAARNDFFANLGGLIVIFVVVGLILNFLPYFIASSRKHPNKLPIFLVVFFFGWSGIGWVIALIWAFTNPRQVMVVKS